MTRKTVTSSRPAALNPSARNLWLASLGAMSLARKQGEKLVTALVEEGQATKARAERLGTSVAEDLRRQVDQLGRQVKNFVEPFVRQATQVAADIQSGFGERLTEVLGRIGVPNRQDMADLTARVSSLGSKMKARNVRAPARRRSAVRRQPTAKRA